MIPLIVSISIFFDFLYKLPLNLLFFDFTLISIILIQRFYLGTIKINKNLFLLLLSLFILNILKLLLFKQTDFFSEIRLILIIFDGIVLSLILKKEDFLRLLSYISFFFFFIFIIETQFVSQSIFIPQSNKQLVATFPSVILLYFFLKEKKGFLSLLIFIFVIFIGFNYSSRILILISTTLFIVHYFKNKFLLFLIVCIGIYLVNILSEYILISDYSNIVRYSFFESLFVNFDIFELMIGMGFENYRDATYELFMSKDELIEGRSYNLLYIDGGNPHFILIEIIVYFGLIGFGLISYVFLNLIDIRNFKTFIILFVMSISFLTSNTGFERIYLSMIISLILIFYPRKIVN